MKRKAIEKIPYAGVHTFCKKAYLARAFEADVEGESHLITEVYQKPDKKLPVVRIVLNRKEYENYFPERKEWTRQRISCDGEPVWERPMQPHGQDQITIDVEEEALVKRYTGMEDRRCANWKYGIADYQWNMYAAARDRRERKQKKLAEEREADTPELPKAFESWYKNVLFAGTNILFYKRHGRYADLTCGGCGGTDTVCIKKLESFEGQFEKTVPVPKNGDTGTCPVCGTPGIFRSRLKAGVYALNRKCYIGQKFRGNNAVIWYVEVEKIMCKGRPAGYTVVEIARNYFTDGQNVQKDYHLCNYTGEDQWYPRNIGGNANIVQEKGRVFPETCQELKDTVLQYSGMEPYINHQGEIKLTSYMEAYKRYPVMEMLSKMGLYDLVEHLTDGYTPERLFPAPEAKDPCVLMGVSREKLKRLITAKGMKSLLYLLQMEQRLGQNWKEEQEEAVLRMRLDLGKLETALKVISIQKLINQIGRYTGTDLTAAGACAAMDMGVSETARLYLDYLEMKTALGYDMTDEICLRPRSLRQAHREAVEESRGREDDLRVKIAEEKYSKIAERFKELDQYYHFEDEQYIIRPAKNAAEIIAEGRTLHHCVGRDSYLKNHHEGRSIILFLRHKKEPDIPYITIEITDTRIQQWYGAYDKKPEEAENRKWLEQYTTRLKAKKQSKGIRIRAAG